MIKESFKETVELPQGISVEVEGHMVTVKAEGKENSRIFKAKGISFKKLENGLEIEATPAKRSMNAKMKTIIGHIKNMISGLGTEFEYKLAIVFSHFPMTVNVKGDSVEINNFAGEKNPRKARIMPGVKVEVKGHEVIVTGINKESVGQTSANLENATKVRGRDRRIFQDGIFIVSKPKKV